MTRESVHQLRVCVGTLLLGVSAAAQLRLFDLPLVHPLICALAAYLFFPRPPGRSSGKSENVLIPFAAIVALNVAAHWWLEKTGQTLQDSPWFIVPVYVWFLWAMSLDAAKTIRLLPVADAAAGPVHTNAS